MNNTHTDVRLARSGTVVGRRLRCTLAVLVVAAIVAGCSQGSTNTSSSGNGQGSQSTSASQATSTGSIGGSSQSSTSESSVATSGGGTVQAPTGARADLAALVPESYRSKGYLNVASESYPTAVIVPPSGGAPTGWEPDTAAALSKLLGIKFRINIIPFSGVVPGLEAKRFDLAMGALGVTDARRKVAIFVTENEATLAVMAKASSDIQVAAEMDLCGKSVAVLVGSTQVPAVQAAQGACKAAGKSTVDMNTFQSQNDANLAVQSGRVQLVIAGTGTLNYVLQQTPGVFKLFPINGDWTQPHQTGIAIPNTPDGLALGKALAAGMNELIKNGTYAAIYNKWNSGQGMIAKSEVLPPQS